MVFASRMLLAAVLTGVCMAALGGCAQTTTSAEGPSLHQGFAAYQADNYSQAAINARQYIAANPEGTQLDDAYYLLGISHETQGQFHRARQAFERAISLTHQNAVLRKANKALGDMAFAKGHYSQAASYYQAAMAAMNGHTPPATMLFKYGAALQDSGHWNAAREPLSKAVADAPGSTAAIDAQQRLAVNHFALQYGAFLFNKSAWALVGQLRSAGISATVVPSLVGGRTLYLVQSGNYSTLPAAMAARNVESHRYPQVLVVP